VDWKPVIIFYTKTTSWIIFPLVLGVLLGKYVGSFTGSQALFFLIMLAGFCVTCFGIYREIRQYKKDLDPPSPEDTDGQEKDGK